MPETDYVALYATPTTNLGDLQQQTLAALLQHDRVNVFTVVGSVVSVVFSAVNKPAGVLVVDHTGRVGGLKADEAAAVRAGFTYLTDNFHKVEKGHARDA